MSKNLIASFSKAGAKVNGLFETTKYLEKFFFEVFLLDLSKALLRKGKKDNLEGTS